MSPTMTGATLGIVALMALAATYLFRLAERNRVLIRRHRRHSHQVKRRILDRVRRRPSPLADNRISSLQILTRFDQLQLGESPWTQISTDGGPPHPLTLIFPDTYSDSAFFVMTEGDAIIKGTKIFTNGLVHEGLVLYDSVSGYTMTVVTALLSANRTYTFPDTGTTASTSVVTTLGSQDIAGTKTMLSALRVTAPATGPVVWQPGGVGNTMTLAVDTPASSYTLTLPDPGAAQAAIVTTPQSSFVPIPPSMDVVTSFDQRVTQAFPTIWSLPKTATIWNYSTTNAAVGDTVVYTVPAGYYSVATMSFWNLNALSNTITGSTSPDGGTTKYTYGSNAVVSMGGGAGGGNGLYTVYLPGDSVVISTTQTSMQLIVNGIQWPISDSNMVSATIRGMTATEAVLYQCPVGKRAITISARPSGWSYGTGAIRFTNGAGSSSVFTAYVTVGGVKAVFAQQSIAANAAGAISMITACILSAGDTITAKTSVAHTLSWAWMTIAEFDASDLVLDDD